MNKNLPVEIWGMIEVERRRAFRRRVEEFERKICEAWEVWANVHWKWLWSCYFGRLVAPYRETLDTKRLFFIERSKHRLYWRSKSTSRLRRSRLSRRIASIASIASE